jgi:hypothetical protein
MKPPEAESALTTTETPRAPFSRMAESCPPVPAAISFCSRIG